MLSPFRAVSRQCAQHLRGIATSPPPPPTGDFQELVNVLKTVPQAGPSSLQSQVYQRPTQFLLANNNQNAAWIQQGVRRKFDAGLVRQQHIFSQSIALTRTLVHKTSLFFT